MNDDLKKQLIEGYEREIEKAESHIVLNHLHIHEQKNVDTGKNE